MAQDKLWTRSFIVLMGVNFCSALSFYLIMVKITEFASDTYGVAQSVAGLTITAYVLAALLTRLLFGGQIDRWGVKRSLAIGSAINAVALLLYLVPMGFEALMVVRIVHGFAFALMSGSAAAGAALIVPRNRYGEGIGYFATMQALATGIGPFVAIWVTNVFGGYSPMFAVAAFIAVLALASVSFVSIRPDGDGSEVGEPATAADEGSPRAGHEKARPSIRHMRVSGGIGSFVQMSVLPLSSVLLLVYICYAGILSFVTSYADHRGLSEAVSLYFVVYAIVIMVTRPPVGRRVDRRGENSTIYACFAALAVGFVVLAFADNGIVLLVSAALIGFGIGATQSIVQAVIARDTHPEEMGKANSTFFMSMDLGSGIGPVVIGALIPLIGYSGSYLVLAGVAACAAVLYHGVHGGKPERKRHE